ncbi:hypothetical protein DIZ81_12300 [Legionella taurinensis]|uniref:Uncharacterized protein n=1 Tax=Legionella taurinensis TaxID=70611 RepID=A0AB38N1K4_9GAMM|nr:hypothetical protein [Legionella taurinensis]MDX1838523.1 hypothetical protein [Legionella taurinensis]PUT38964.1 hypothetical protein DB744_12310 [Legionella taurinensis]PUT41025.1 hypothetical protein DB746_10705 [Legionella taurinensis]PUT43257.1 hypothetical protein DB743_11705 [Legionella taurinensis]PUT46443.1 hypothetical protein DB745_11190 [Legionella taurinensis]
MPLFNRLGLSWLVDNASRNKAKIKFAIRQGEVRLHRLMTRGHLSSEHYLVIASSCQQLVALYDELMTLMAAPDQRFTEEKDAFNPSVTVSESYLNLLKCRQQLLSPAAKSEEMIVLARVKRHYLDMVSLLAGSEQAIPAETGKPDHLPLLTLFDQIIKADSPADWLWAMTRFANTAGEKTAASGSLFLHLDDQQLIELDHRLALPEFRSLINSIFYYWINPGHLYDFSLHAEKMISVRNRFNTLYQFIVFFHQHLLQALRQRGIHSGHDFLFHGSELPEGITVEAEKKYQGLITEVIKDWRLTHWLEQEERLGQAKLSDIFRAYKYWFNPNRLIDAAMSLKASLASGFPVTQGNVLFNQQMKRLYQHLSTTDCLDLYGYFANKDSSYLMRTLDAACHGHEITDFPPLTLQERDTVFYVYSVLETIMEALREALDERGMTTVAYERQVGLKKVKPGRRNLQALRRVISLYAEPSPRINQRLEALFKEVEG